MVWTVWTGDLRWLCVSVEVDDDLPVILCKVWEEADDISEQE